MEARPKHKIELYKLDKIIEALCFTLLIVLWFVTLFYYAQLPEQIPNHYNAAGKADGYGNKTTILTLPAIASIIYVGISLLNKHPQLYNYPTVVTEQNAKSLYASASRLMRIIKFVVVLIFSGIVFITYKNVLTGGDGLGTWFLPICVSIIILPTIFYFLKSVKA